MGERTPNRRERDADGDQQGRGAMRVKLLPIQIVAAVLALLVAATHLSWGWPRFRSYVAVGTMPDPRPAVFVLTGLLIVLAITAVAIGVVDARPVYLGGIVLVLCYLFGYVAWHTVLDHGAFWPWAPQTHSHGSNPVRTVVVHLENDALAAMSKVFELLLLVVLSVLYWVETRYDVH